MTKQQQIEILSRICDTASMASNDQNDLREVIKEMKNEPEPQFVTTYALDKLISSSSGSWKLCYVYNRFGYNTLMLLPTDEGFCSIDGAAEILMDMNEWEFEHSLIIDHYIRRYPNNPFIIRENGFIECIKELTSRLFQLIDEDGFGKFYKECDKFFDFIRVCKQIHDRESEGFVYQVLNKGWENFIPKKSIKREFDKEYELLAEMYKDPYIPRHFLDIIRMNLTNIIHNIEMDVSNIDEIKRAFQTFVTDEVSMLDNFFHVSERNIDFGVIIKDIEYILSWFDIDIDIKDLMERLE